MDDSREIILITNGSLLDEEKGDVILLLNESEVKVDSIRETDDTNKFKTFYQKSMNETVY